MLKNQSLILPTASVLPNLNWTNVQGHAAVVCLDLSVEIPSRSLVLVLLGCALDILHSVKMAILQLDLHFGEADEFAERQIWPVIHMFRPECAHNAKKLMGFLMLSEPAHCHTLQFQTFPLNVPQTLQDFTEVIFPWWMNS